MFQTDTPPAPPAAAEVVVARTDHSVVAATLDLPLTLTKAGRREEMVVRRALFVTAQITQVRAPTATDASADRYRWKLAGYLQRTYCVRSLTGLLACTTPETEALPDKGEGDADLTAPGDYRLAIAAEGGLSGALASRSEEIFAADRLTVVDPMLKAAGVVVPKVQGPAHHPGNSK